MSGLTLSTDEHDASCHSSTHLPMHYLRFQQSELPRTTLPRTPVNKGRSHRPSSCLTSRGACARRGVLRLYHAKVKYRGATKDPSGHPAKLTTCADKNHAAPTAKATETKWKLPYSRTRLPSPPNSTVTPPKANAPTAAKPTTAPRMKEKICGGLGSP